MQIPIIGNGDIVNATIASEMFNIHGVDAIMIGRAAIGNPWIFNDIKAFMQNREIIAPPELPERIAVSLAHLWLAIQKKGNVKVLLKCEDTMQDISKDYPGSKKSEWKFSPCKV